MVFLSHTLYAWKILIWRNFGHLRQKFGHFLAKIDSFESFFGPLPEAEMGPINSRPSVRPSVRP